MPQVFKVLVGLKTEQGDPIHFKVDGGRFNQARTLKLNVNANYIMEISVKPHKEILSLNVFGGNVTIEEITAKNQTAYVTTWNTAGFDMAKKGNRQQIPIIAEIKDIGTFKVNLQCKFYGETEKQHVNWGDACHFIDYDCKLPDGSSFVDVVKETFR
ncbi:unnamed protein product [Owenia fusiformis]|uniref:CB1 cannabinoid receptor-interacting protein 1 n=1 Tax=Owenia fusiformis TaxID=6347 RepID=A0A8S4PJE0_OWEFU|nr:unnamed protein product [Owenia fusiformis]